MNTHDTRTGRLDRNFGEWHKASRSHPAGNDCVEVAFSSSAVGVRDSKGDKDTVLVFDHDGWNTFRNGVNGGTTK